MPHSGAAEGDPAPTAGRESRIVGGTVAADGAWPTQVALVDRTASNTYQGQFCGGTVVDRSWILTAGHCVYDPPDWTPTASQIDVIVGTNSLSGGGTRIRAVEIRMHPGWNNTLLRNDVALMDARLSGSDMSLNAPLVESESGGSSERLDFLVDEAPLPDETVSEAIDSERRVRWLRSALTVLSDRELNILRARRLSDESATLESLGDRLGILGVALGYLAGTVVIAAIPITIVWRRDHHRWAGLFLRVLVALLAVGALALAGRAADLPLWLEPVLAAVFLAGWVLASRRDLPRIPGLPSSLGRRRSS